jgi:hypothetical protein
MQLGASFGPPTTVVQTQTQTLGGPSPLSTDHGTGLAHTVPVHPGAGSNLPPAVPVAPAQVSIPVQHSMVDEPAHNVSSATPTPGQVDGQRSPHDLMASIVGSAGFAGTVLACAGYVGAGLEVCGFGTVFSSLFTCWEAARQTDPNSRLTTLAMAAGQVGMGGACVTVGTNAPSIALIGTCGVPLVIAVGLCSAGKYSV